MTQQVIDMPEVPEPEKCDSVAHTGGRKGRRNGSKPRKKPARSYQKHGHYRLTRAVKELGNRAMDGRLAVVKAMNREKADIIADQGGRENMATVKLGIVDEFVKSKMVLGSIDAWLAVQKSIVNKRKRSLYPIVRERQALVDSLARLGSLIGLERRAKPVMDLAEHWKQKDGA